MPGVATIVAWRGCDHLGPVFEGDILATTVEVEGLHELDDVDAGLADLRMAVSANRARSPAPVLDLAGDRGDLLERSMEGAA